MTASHIARVIAQRVVAEVMKGIDRDPDEFLSIADRLAVVLHSSPVACLAGDEEIDAASLVRTARLARFEARWCRRLPERKWHTEDHEIAESVIRTLAGRYLRYL